MHIHSSHFPLAGWKYFSASRHPHAATTQKAGFKSYCSLRSTVVQADCCEDLLMYPNDSLSCSTSR